jgi:hypothetical protein
MINGRDCVIRLKTKNADAVIPFLSETLREKIFLAGSTRLSRGRDGGAGLLKGRGRKGG